MQNVSERIAGWIYPVTLLLSIAVAAGSMLTTVTALSSRVEKLEGAFLIHTQQQSEAIADMRADIKILVARTAGPK